ncbi:MAG: Cof-type HAD-IIB family hydrolase [Erysipelotrichaceae bacterium]|nr:Cof-type HAD-IIB family hydrolase [Erysipelotrichaceae bacterium]
MIKAVFLDFDGTIFSHRTSCIPASTITAVKKLKENKILAFLCTGRALGEMHDFDLSELKLDGWILSNGQMILDEEKQIIYERCMDETLKNALVTLFNKKEMAMYLVNRDDIYLNQVTDKVRTIQSVISSGIPKVKEYQGEDLYMASAFFANEKDEEKVIALKDIAEITWWQEGCVDIVPKGISKTNGIDVICERYGISKDETLGIGDGENDIKMLKHCAIGIAMGNSYPALKECADYITDNIDEDGLYNALVHYGLI